MSLNDVFDPVVRAYFDGKVAGGSGFTPPASEVLDPDEVYRVTRPADWLTMPMPGDNEMYLLGMIYDGIPAKFGLKAAYSSSGSCFVEIGTLVNGVFTAKDSFSPATGVPYIYDIPAEEYGDETTEGDKQYMVRITGSGVSSLVFDRPSVGIVQNIVDVVSGMRCALFFGSTSSSSDVVMSLRYLRFVGNGNPIQTQGLAGRCQNLLSISCEKDFVTPYPSYSFVNCLSLMAISPTVGATVGTSTYQSCGLNRVPNPQKPPTNLTNAYRESRITFIDGSTFGSVTNMTSAFYTCSCLRQIVNLNISSLIAVDSTTFGYCNVLQRLTFAGENTPGGITLNLTQTVLSHDALIEMIESLPVATDAATITITGVPGASELTDAEIAVATEKNWTITR